MIPLSDTLKQHHAYIDIGYSIGPNHYRLHTTFDGLTVSDTFITIQRTTNSTEDDTNRFEMEYTIQAQGVSTDMVRLHHFEILFETDLTDNTMMAEGFQAWSQTREMDKTSSLPAISSPVAWITKFDLQGDYNFFKHSGKKGMIHSTGYTYLRDINDDSLLFLGSLSEHNGYSYFKFDFDSHRFSLYKDVQGKTLPSGDALTFGFLALHHHDQTTLWKRYASRLLPSLTSPPVLTGWTSWYNFYEAVTEQDVMDSMAGLVKHGYPVDLIQIDDGYEKAIGDWLDVDTVKFPRGMKFLANEIKRNNAMAGIWLAPFAVGLDSKIAKEHPHWIVYQSDGNPLLAGPNWGGFRALDIYHPEVRDYLKRVFDTVIDDWGYKFLKLDFIFAAAMIPRYGKSRGEIMWDAISLIDELTDKRARLLGCGVTLPSVWGRMDYSRVSSDASPWWDHSILRIGNVRERVATYNALVSTLHRWPMNNVMFGNDPDVFFIRSNNNQLTADERYTLVVINNLLGQMALMSDNVALYSSQEHALYSQTFPKAQVTIERMDSIGSDVYRLHYLCNGRPYVTITNVSPRPFHFRLPTFGNDDSDSVYFEYGNVLLDASTVQWIDAKKDGLPLKIRPHQTRTFMRIVDDFAGSTGHILPGWDIETIDKHKQDMMLIRLRQPRLSTQETRLFFKATHGDDTKVIFIDDKKINAIHQVQLKTNAAPFPLIYLDYPL